MAVSLKRISDGITKQLESYVSRANAVEGYFNRVVVEQYRNAQRERWKSENATEGTNWETLRSESYKKWKSKKYGSDPETGRPLLIASGKLQKSVIGPGDGFKKVTTPRSLTIVTTIDYAEWVDEARTFTSWSSKTVRDIRRGVADFIVKNRIKMARAF